MRVQTINTTDGLQIFIHSSGEPTGADNKCWQGPFYGTHEGRVRAAEYIREHAHAMTYREAVRAWRRIAKG